MAKGRGRGHASAAAAIVSILAVAFLIAAGHAAAEDVPHVKNEIDGYCSSRDRHCTAVAKDDGKLYLVYLTKRSVEKYRLCVTSPTGRERCKRYPVNVAAGDHRGSVVPFRSEYPHKRNGTYRVAWRRSGNRIGPVLRFEITRRVSGADRSGAARH